MKITFLGGGNMAVALIGGLLKRGFKATDVQVVELSGEGRARLAADFGVRAIEAIDDAALACDVLVLAVKPQQLRAAVAPIAGRLDRQLVVSIAAGLRLADIGRWLGGHGKLVRCMPNTPALIGAGITGLFADASVDAAGRAAAEEVLAAVGSTVWVQDEAQIDGVTAISGSGPAYVFLFIEAMQQAAMELGFTPKQARQLSIETTLGAARLAAQSEEPASILRERVTSKGGTTEAALRAMAECKVKEGIVAGAMAANARGAELGELLGKDD